MKNKTLLSIIVFLITHFIVYGQNESKVTPIKLTEISKEIISMKDQDQEYRHKWGKLVREGKTNSKKFKKISKKLITIDSNNTNRIREIVERYGWPTYDLVGKKASKAAWLIVQHADRNPLVQMYCLPLLKDAVDRQQADPSNYAYLYDRVQIAKGEKQLYATQSTTNNGLVTGYFQPIEDESNVQKRREEMRVRLLGVGSASPTAETVEAYAEALGFEYKVPSEKEAIQRDKEWAKAYQENIEMAHQSMKSKDYSSAIDYYSKAIQSHGYVQTEDYVELARAISISKHENCSGAFYYLIKAAIRGWKGINEFDTHEDFKNIKLANTDNWLNLMIVVDELNLKKKKAKG